MAWESFEWKNLEAGGTALNKTNLNSLETRVGKASAIPGSIESGGGIKAGSGFTVEHSGTGLYLIKLTTELATVGSIVATPITTLELPWVIQTSATAKKEFTVKTFISKWIEAEKLVSVESKNVAFSFLIVAC